MSITSGISGERPDAASAACIGTVSSSVSLSISMNIPRERRSATRNAASNPFDLRLKPVQRTCQSGRSKPDYAPTFSQRVNVTTANWCRIIFGGEMAEWFKAHAWKTEKACCTASLHVADTRVHIGDFDC